MSNRSLVVTAADVAVVGAAAAAAAATAAAVAIAAATAAAALLLLALAGRAICLCAIPRATHLSTARTGRAFTGARTRTRRTQSRTLGIAVLG